jgi:Uncharacterized conserved protein
MQQKDYLTTNKIANYVGSTFYHRGVRYFKENRVSGIELSGLEIAGLVKGSGCKVYRSVINSNGRGGIKSSSCSCPIGGGCKHIAALGLAFLNWGDEPQEAEIISRENQNIAPVKSKVASVKKRRGAKNLIKLRTIPKMTSKRH